MTDRKKILERVAALIALATKNDNPNESESAMRKARALMEQYRIAEYEIRGDDTSINCEGFRTTLKRIPDWMKILATGVGNAVGCRAVHVGSTLTAEKAMFLIVGKQLDREVARYLLDSLIVQINTLARSQGRKWKKSKRKRQRMQDYRQGLAMGVTHRLQDVFGEKQENTTYVAGLVRIGDLKAADLWIQENIGVTYSRTNLLRGSDLRLGLAHSNDLTVARGVSGSQDRQAQLLPSASIRR